MPKSPILSAALAASVLALTACSISNPSSSIPGAVAGNGDLSSLRDFASVEATGPDDVIVTVGPAYKVTVEGDAKVLERLEIGVKNGTLYVGRKSRIGIMWSNDDEGATVRVTMPAMAAASLTGSGNMKVDTVNGGRLALSLTGSGNIDLGKAKVGMLKVDTTGSGDLNIGGTADSATLSATGSGGINAGALKAGKAEIDILGSGNVKLASDGPVNVSIMGSGNADVRGKAQCKIKAMGSGEARCTA